MPAKQSLKQKQIPVALPAELRAALDEAAATSGHSVGWEIRRRLTASINDDAHLTELLETVRYFARRTRDSVGVDWFEHPVAFAVFQHAIESFLGERSPALPSETRPDLLAHSQDDAATMGRTIARLFAIDQERKGLDKLKDKHTDLLKRLED